MMKKVAFNNLSVGDIAEVSWNFGDNTPISKEIKPTHEYAAFGTYKVCLSLLTKAGCKSEYCAEVKVANLAPTCKFDIVGKLKEGTKNTFLFSTVSQAEIKTWKWSFGDGKTSDLKNPEVVYEKPGTYEVTCTVTTAAGCTETRVIKQTVLATPLAPCSGAISLLLFDPTDKCNGKATVKLVNDGATEITGVQYIWSHGFIGSVAENLCPDKTYTVRAVIEGKCEKNTSFTLLSKPVWTAANVSGQIKFTVITPVEGVVYEWNFGNGVFLKGAEVDYSFKNDGIYDVTLKAVSGTDFTEYSQKVEVLKSVTKVVKIENPELDVYPNPVKDVLKIKFGNPVEGNIQIGIMNIAGKSVYSQSINADGLIQTEVNVNQLNPGIYFLRIMNGKNRIADRKFVKAD
jgi:PKD repeat protein